MLARGAAGVFVTAPLLAQVIVLDRFHVQAPASSGSPPASVAASQLQTHLPIDLGAVLAREVPNLTAVRRAGVASDVLLRGLGRDNVGVRLDGAPAHAACPGRMDPPMFHVSTPLIGRITVHAGPFDVRQGAAPGGAIVITSAEPPATPAAAVGVMAGSAALYSADAIAGGPLGRGWRGIAGASYQQGRAYRDGDGRRATEQRGTNFRPEVHDDRAFATGHLEAHATWSSAGQTLTLRAAGNDARDVLYPALMMDAQRDRATRLAAAWESTTPAPLADRWRLEVHRYRVQHDMSDALRLSSRGPWQARGYMMRTVAATTSYGLSGEAELAAPAGQVVYGGQLGNRHWVADNVVGANANAMLPDATTRQAGVFVQAEHARAPWKWQAGARLDAWRTRAARDIAFVQRAHGTARNARADAAPSGFVLGERAWADAFAIFAGLGHGARVPDAQERYIAVDRPGAGTDWVGNPGLGLVRATEWAAGARVRAGRARIVARAFVSRLDNFVVLGALAPAPGAAANPLRTESYFGVAAQLAGAELTAEAPLGSRWHVKAATSAQRGRRRGALGPGADRDLPEIPPWRGRAVLRWMERLSSIEAELEGAARQTRLDRAAGERPIAGYAVLHLRAEHALSPSWGVAVGVDNVLDRTYATHNAYVRDPFAAGTILNEPGRFGYLRLRWRK